MRLLTRRLLQALLYQSQPIATLLRGGCTRKDTAGSVGVTDDTFSNWMRRYSDFSEVVRAAESYVGARMTAKITASDTDWWAALEWLKRRRRDDWGDSLNLIDKSDTDPPAAPPRPRTVGEPPGGAVARMRPL